MQNIIADIMPKNAGMPKIGIYLINSVSLAAIKVMMVIIMMGVRNFKDPPVPPQWLSFVVMRIIAFIVLHKICANVRYWRNLSSSKVSPDGKSGETEKDDADSEESEALLEMNLN